MQESWKPSRRQLTWALSLLLVVAFGAGAGLRLVGVPTLGAVCIAVSFVAITCVAGWIAYLTITKVPPQSAAEVLGLVVTWTVLVALCIVLVAAFILQRITEP